jgi:hypothetical protein
VIKTTSSTVATEKFQRFDQSSYVATAKLNRAKVLKLKEWQQSWGRGTRCRRPSAVEQSC